MVNLSNLFGGLDTTRTGPQFKNTAPIVVNPQDHVVRRIFDLTAPTLKRIANLALPIIHMYKPASTVIKTAFTAYKVASVLVEGDMKEIAKLATGAALKTLLPELCDVAEGAYGLFTDASDFALHMRTGDFKSAASEFLSIVSTAAELGLMVYGGPELLILGLLTQGLKEIGQSYEEFGKGNYPECALNLLCAALRLEAAKPHYQEIHRNVFGNDISQTDLDALFKEIMEMQQLPEFKDTLIDFNELLVKHNFKSKIEGLSFDNKQISHVAFKNLSFLNSTFKNAEIRSSTFDNVIFNNCELLKTRMIHCKVENSYFINSILKRAELNWSVFNGSVFAQSDLSGVSLNNAELKNVYFTFCNLFESTFFETKVASSKIISSNLKDCLLFDTKEQFYMFGNTAHEITRPVVGLLYQFEEPKQFAKGIDESLRNHTDAIVFRFHYLPKEIDTDALDLEVKAKLESYKNLDKNLRPSIAKHVIAHPENDSELGKIRNYAEKIMPHLDGLILPGGRDVEPEFYGEALDPETFPDPNYLRSIFEFNVIDQAEKKDLPTLGVCRGSQVTNVFFGGTLEQHIPGHYKVFQLLKMKTSAFYKETGKIAHEILGGKYIVGLSMHYQASKKIAKNLDVVLEHEGVPKMMISKPKKGMSYPTFVLTQFHPEMTELPIYQDGDYFENNHNLITNLVNRGRAYRATKQA